jgi:hypothetical protein
MDPKPKISGVPPEKWLAADSASTLGRREARLGVQREGLRLVEPKPLALVKGEPRMASQKKARMASKKPVPTAYTTGQRRKPPRRPSNKEAAEVLRPPPFGVFSSRTEWLAVGDGNDG